MRGYLGTVLDKDLFEEDSGVEERGSKGEIKPSEQVDGQVSSRCRMIAYNQNQNHAHLDPSLLSPYWHYLTLPPVWHQLFCPSPLVKLLFRCDQDLAVVVLDHLLHLQLLVN